ncbi:MAG TPA: GDP-mannose 4,6-dehydratase [Thermoanaerobaculia bacterium]|nr:GDP-mannose 4,6-dehydratase [Thermoanaerobaculia bacterium]
MTGADGFIGSHLTERLVNEGAAVRAFCLYNSQGSLGWLDRVPAEIRQGLDLRLGDIRDSRFVEQAAEDIEIIFHLAALIAIPYSYQAPESFVETNVRGTMNVLEAARRNRCTRVVHTSTSEVYGTPREIPIRESHPLQGQSPYSASKIAADKLCEAYFCSFGLPVVTLRPFNTFGPRQSTRAVIPTILVQLLAGKTRVELGRVDTRRDVTFVADTVDGFVRAATAEGVEGDVIQLGTGRSESVYTFFQISCRILGVKAEIVQSQERFRPDKSEVMVLQSDPSRAREKLGWQATTSLDDGLARTTEWLKTSLNLYDAGRYHV